MLRKILADSACAAVVALMAALVLASLSAAGVVTIHLAEILLGLAWVAGLGLTFLIDPIFKMSKIDRIVFAVSLAAFLSVVGLYEGHHQAQAQSDTAPQIVAPNNTGIVTQFQSGGTNIIVSKLPPRGLDDRFRDFVRKNLTDKSIPIVPMVLVGDDQDERSNLATEIEEFLKSDGYTVRQRVYFLAPGTLPKGIIVDNKSNPASIKIGINVGDAQ